MTGLINEVGHVNFVVKLVEYTTYEFTTPNYVHVEEADVDARLFRIIIRANGEIEIYIANDEDYDFHEDVTYLFDVDAIKTICENQKVLHDHTQEYIDHYRERRDMGENVSLPVCPSMWIVLSEEGYTVAPNDAACENLQVLGFVKGVNLDEAMKNFKEEYQYQLTEHDFDGVIIYPLLTKNPFSWNFKEDEHGSLPKSI